MVTVGVGDVPGATIRAVDVVLDDELRPLQARHAVGLDAGVPLDARRTAIRERAMAAAVALELGAPSSGSPTASREPRPRRGGWT